MHSSQNEQDSRFYGKFALVPTFEPSTQQEAYEMVQAAFDFSEKYRIPVLMRLTTRMAHSRAMVEPREARPENSLAYPARTRQWVLMPGNSRVRYEALLADYARFEEEAAASPFNRYADAEDKSLGIIACGIAYNYLAENYPDGTYFYQDVTQDGQTDVFNVCQPNRITDGVDEDDYLCAAARALDPESSTVYQLGDVVQDPDDSQALSYPVYRITFTTGANEDQRDWTVFALNTDSHTYFYAFRATPQAAEDLSDLYADIFSQLTLADPAQSGNNAIRRNQT